jgi:integrase
MCYRLALSTGFRAKELRSLTPESFDLGGALPVVIVAAAYSKRRRVDRQPIRQDLADVLRPWLAGKPAGERLFGRLPGGTARMLRADLDAARRAWLKEAPSDEARAARAKCDFLLYRNAAGKVVDFHATRHTYISGIVAGGASVKTAQEFARHSDPALTIGRYAHARRHDLQDALDGLPALGAVDPQGGNRAGGGEGHGDRRRGRICGGRTGGS